eukprot:1789312-Prymnesium_polylepis.1
MAYRPQRQRFSHLGDLVERIKGEAAEERTLLEQAHAVVVRAAQRVDSEQVLDARWSRGIDLDPDHHLVRLDPSVAILSESLSLLARVLEDATHDRTATLGRDHL